MLLQVRNLSKSFGGVRAVEDLSLSVESGEIVGMIGPNGAGKTTVFNLLTGFCRADRGQVLLADRNIVGLRPHQVCQLGMTKTFQIPRPFATLTALQNVMVAALAHGQNLTKARQTARECLILVGLEPQLNVQADHLSTGQRKRLEFARALATEPRLLLLDEPTAGVDQKGLPGLIGLIKRLCANGTALFVIEHNLQVVRQVSDRIIAMHLGHKIAEGEPDSVLKDPRVISAHLGKQDFMIEALEGAP